MDVRTIIKKIKQQIKIRKIKIYSLEKTVDYLKNQDCSIGRFGDGEFYIMCGRNIKFQNTSSELQERLITIFKSNEKNFLVATNDWIIPKNRTQYTKKHILWIKKYLKNNLEMRLNYIDTNRFYANALITRFWIPFKDKKRAKRNAYSFKEVWQNRDVVIVEGEKTRMGVGNDLLEDVKSCKRILCPAENAFFKYNEIFEAAKTFEKGTLFLIALGPTATVLAYDLHKLGYQALDIGHIDLEYEWMKLGATEQVIIKNKYVNELEGGNIVASETDQKYLKEIAFEIKD